MTTTLAFRFCCGAVAFAGWANAQSSNHGHALLVVSIDGLRPDYVLGQSHAGIKVPNLRKLASEGVSAAGVRGVLPTVT